MILAVHIPAINGHPYSVHAIGAEGPEIVCQIGPALVRPDGWRIPEGSPRTHRQCVNWGLPMRELLATVLRMSELANVFVGDDWDELSANMRAWSAGDKSLISRLDPWARPGPERVSCHMDMPPKDAADILAAYWKLREAGVAA